MLNVDLINFWQGACAGHLSRYINHFKTQSFMNLIVAYYSKRINMSVMRRNWKLCFIDKL